MKRPDHFCKLEATVDGIHAMFAPGYKAPVSIERLQRQQAMATGVLMNGGKVKPGMMPGDFKKRIAEERRPPYAQ